MTTTLPATASEYFGSMVESYDSLIQRAVPRYHEMTDRLLEAALDLVLPLRGISSIIMAAE